MLTSSEFRRVCIFVWGRKWADLAGEVLRINRRSVGRWGSDIKNQPAPDWVYGVLEESAKLRIAELRAEIAWIEKVLEIEP